MSGKKGRHCCIIILKLILLCSHFIKNIFDYNYNNCFKLVDVYLFQANIHRRHFSHVQTGTHGYTHAHTHAHTQYIYIYTLIILIMVTEHCHLQKH